MDFFGRAWNSAADQYGRDRGEKYGTIARLINWLAVIASIALIMGITYIIERGPQG